MPSDEEELVGESELYDLVNGIETQAAEIAERLDLTNEDLQRIQARWAKIAENGDGYRYDGHIMVHMTHAALLRRRLAQLVSMMKPDEEMVPLIELATRFDESDGGDA